LTTNRYIYKQLINWRLREGKKPLVLRGARQVGKTTLVKEFSKEFQHYISLNLELPNDIYFFKKYADPRELIEAILVKFRINSSDLENCLLFIDEIQESKEALNMLRYFYEFFPNLSVIAAGSLLEQALNSGENLPVGRVEYLHLYPFNFTEFLEATQDQYLLNALNEFPRNRISHQALMEAFHRYIIIGGMPEVVMKYAKNGQISDCLQTYNSIWKTYKRDVSKYAKNATDAKIIRHIMSVAHEYIDERVKFQNFGNSNYKSREVGEAFRNLHDAKIIQLVFPTVETAIPLHRDFKKTPRMQFLDTGLLNNELNIQSSMIGVKDLSDSYKGRIVPHMFIQEIISLHSFGEEIPPFWVREKTQSSAEVDLIFQYKDLLIPIEVKSGKIGKLKSLLQYIDATNHPFAIRVYGGEFCVENHKTIKGKEFKLLNIPYYLGTQLTRIIEKFVAEEEF
jgi:predicted AAA+ superfamily ATPase